MAIPAQDQTDVFTVIDRTYGLVDGSATWSDCLETLVRMAALDASRLMLYDCSRGQSHVAKTAGAGVEAGRTIQHLKIDDALWQAEPAVVWTPSDDQTVRTPLPGGLRLHGCAVLDRDSAHILYLEFLCSTAGAQAGSPRMDQLAQALPHLHRACRLHRSITGEDLAAFIEPDVDLPSPPVGLPIELRLRRRFKLSKAEARVATLLSDGLAPRVIADRLNVSIHTVRSQLQAIFNKTDTSRQAELTSLILRETELPRSVCHSGTVGAEGRERPPCP